MTDRGDLGFSRVLFEESKKNIVKLKTTVVISLNHLKNNMTQQSYE